MIGIVGPSGSGKSTAGQAAAAALRAGARPRAGRRRRPGPGRSALAAPPDRRRAAGERPVQPHVRDNIALADPALPMERVIEAAKLAGAHDFILKLPQGYDTMVGERGSQPVGRPAPAHRHRPRPGHQAAHPDLRRGDQRARLRDAKSVIQHNMRRIAAGRTVFIIAHRLAACATRPHPHHRGRPPDGGRHA